MEQLFFPNERTTGVNIKDLLGIICLNNVLGIEEKWLNFFQREELGSRRPL